MHSFLSFFCPSSFFVRRARNDFLGYFCSRLAAAKHSSRDQEPSERQRETQRKRKNRNQVPARREFHFEQRFQSRRSVILLRNRCDERNESFPPFFYFLACQRCASPSPVSVEEDRTDGNNSTSTSECRRFETIIAFGGQDLFSSGERPSPQRPKKETRGREDERRQLTNGEDTPLEQIRSLLSASLPCSVLRSVRFAR